MGKAVSALLGKVKGSPHSLSQEEHVEGHSPTPFAAENRTIKLVDVEQDLADRMYLGYLQHISTRWPLLHTPHIAELHCHKDELVDFRDKMILHLIYANGARYLETTGEKLAFVPERHYMLLHKL
ncbi:hypothetical protein PFICI_10585 [Pestalotiopsis fici W106-1]|uniref:Uncharacterized protein n=1 Tax=Pestalotiopsis fici (strain W106-1 / CGMCC3.15140) TaxID=1229662 RepID=W3WXB9_PESFW|nr:uncharacterized protein PFICI_10585 [Pestalotiopsis fici W106-1]ETS78523.1 hypothetical protein PFICI_10585 [Pestalotiopsis fici W106-1]